MRFSEILVVVFSTASVVHAAAVPVNQQGAGLEARACNYDSCSDCHDKDQYCVFCNNGGGIGVSCAVCLAHCDPCC